MWRVIGLVVARLTRHEIEPVLLGGVDGGQGLVVGLVSLIFPEDHLLYRDLIRKKSQHVLLYLSIVQHANVGNLQFGISEFSSLPTCNKAGCFLRIATSHAKMALSSKSDSGHRMVRIALMPVLQTVCSLVSGWPSATSCSDSPHLSLLTLEYVKGGIGPLDFAC